MINLKFKGMKDNCNFFAEEMAKRFFKQFKNEKFDYIVYVPTTAKRLKERGFNPPYIMARKFSDIVGIPIFENLFSRDENSKTQHGLNYSERIKNARDSYIINLDKLPCENFLLIDDICTTGATLNVLSKLLKENGAEKVVCLVGCIGKRHI